jgi:glycosyltransferase involved in cell wall biosynthesis
LPVRVIVVDDGSTDDTASEARRGGAVVARHRRNLGQGDGLRTGFALALQLDAAVVVTMDADGQHDPADVARLVRPVVADEADYVQGSRFLGAYDDAGGARHVGIKGFTTLINTLAGTTITDCTNGYRAIRASRPCQDAPRRGPLLSVGAHHRGGPRANCECWKCPCTSTVVRPGRARSLEAFGTQRATLA